MLAAFAEIAAALRDAGVRYLVAGGLAVNAHGYLRLTQDVDLVIQLDPPNIRACFGALAMTVRERFEALDSLTELSQRLAEMPKDHLDSR